MKKIIMMAVMAVAAVSANAQVYVGGSFGFSQEHESNSGVSDNNFTIVPEVGYNLNEKFAVGATLGYTYTGITNGTHKNKWEIAPYLRYTYVKAGNFSAFVDGGINYATTHTKGLKKNTNDFGFSVNPGIAYAVSDKVTLVAHLKNGLYYKHSWNAAYDGDTGAEPKYGPQSASHSNSWGFDVSSLKLQIGAYYNF